MTRESLNAWKLSSSLLNTPYMEEITNEIRKYLEPNNDGDAAW